MRLNVYLLQEPDDRAALERARDTAAVVLRAIAARTWEAGVRPSSVNIVADNRP